MLRFVVRRGFSTASRLCSAPSAAGEAQTVNRELLVKLRKQTGYSFFNCRKAFVKFDSDVDSAVKWLHEEAAKQGWTKAEKVADRETKQGLCSILSEGNMAALIEVNCETDFVARSDAFKELVAELTIGLLERGKSIVPPISESTLESKSFGAEEVKTRSGIEAKEALAMSIGKLGENITLSKAEVFVSHPSISIYGHSHPNEGIKNIEMGRFVSVIGLQRKAGSTFPSSKLGHQLCQHVIGMNPEKLGTPTPVESEKESAGKHEEKLATDEQETKSELEEDELNAFADHRETTTMDENENQLLRQAFMLNPSQSVSEYLATHGAEIVDFKRFELGK